VTIFGADLSHFDAPDARAMYADGIDFMTHKAGGDANDAEIGTWWGHMEPYGETGGGMLLGAYWVLYPGSPAIRADAFIARLDATCPGWRDMPFILQADCEQWNSDPGTVPSISEVNAFCDRLAERMPLLNPVVYAPKWVYGSSVAALRYPLWASAYVTGSGSFEALYPGDGSSLWDAYGGRTPSILQYSSSATIGGQTTCDADAFRGTAAELTALVAPGWDIDMPLTDADAVVIWGHDGIPNPAQRPDSPKHVPPGTNANTGGSFALGDLWQRTYDLRDAVAALDDKVTALAAGPAITQAQLDLAVLNALKTLAGGQS
jgi:hypothetical protein